MLSLATFKSAMADSLALRAGEDVPASYGERAESRHVLLGLFWPLSSVTLVLGHLLSFSFPTEKRG